MPENIDILYSLSVNIDFLATQLIAAVCFVILCRDFLKRKRGTGFIGSAYFIVTITLYYIHVDLDNFAAYSLAVLAGFMVFVWLDRGNVKMKAFLAATFFVIRWIAFSAMGKVSSLLSGAALKVLGSIVDLTKPESWLYYFIEFVICIIIEIALCGAVLYLCVKALNKVISYKFEDLELKELMLLLIPVLNGMVVSKILGIYIPFYEKENQISVFNMDVFMDILYIFCCAVILASIISTIALYENIRKKRNEENANMILESQMKDIKEHITEVEKLYADIRGVKHDIKNHIEVINGLLAQGKADEVRDYGESLSESVEVFDFSIKTGNPVTDVIIHEKMNLAGEQGIEFISDFHYPDNSGINAFDMSVILSNALSNAIEAAKSGGFVRVSSFRNKNAYLITVENFYDGILEIDATSGIPKTRKHDKNTHGFGLQNIKSVAEKYYGDVQIAQKENKVVLTVMLMAAT